MKVFISHAFGGDDEELAGVLKDNLAAAGLDGYMAERTPRYNLPISDKIRREIEDSEWLVAIITERSHASASVHEEIGYAFGKGVEVTLMVEEGVEAAGVFTYGREYKRFRSSEFGAASREMAEYIRDAPRPPPPQHSLGEAARGLLERRKILPADSDDFAENEHFSHLFSPVPTDSEKPAVLFTACPRDLGNSVDVTAPEFVEWVESIARVEVDGRRVPVPPLDLHVDIGRLLAIDQYPRALPRRDVLAYREFQASGFFEFGTSHLFFGKNKSRKTELHLCYMAGEFWSFLAQARLFYHRARLDAPFTVFLSIKNSDRLRLGNYGDEAPHSSPYGRPSFDRPSPSTHHRNIPLRYSFKSVREATDEEIARVARDAAKQVCNAYGDTTPRCYGKDGSFSWGMWDDVARNASRGDRR